MPSEPETEPTVVPSGDPGIEPVPTEAPDDPLPEGRPTS
jgi:hypothetical protein